MNITSLVKLNFVYIVSNTFDFCKEYIFISILHLYYNILNLQLLMNSYISITFKYDIIITYLYTCHLFSLYIFNNNLINIFIH